METNPTPQTKKPEPKTKRRARLSAVLLAVALAAAACSGSADDAVAAVTSNAAPEAAPAVAEDEAMDDEDAMSDDAMEDDDAMNEDAMSDDAMEDDDAMNEDAMSDEAMSDGGLVLELSGLETLGDAAVYEGWLIVDGAPVTTGRFNIDADGNVAAEEDGGHVFGTEHGDDATAVVITIEPATDPDPAPSATHVLAGDIVDGTASLTIGHPAALGTDFTDASGSYILGTPTDGDGNNELSGVWFIDLPLAAGLNLPTLPDGWHYEGWAVIDGVPVSTGRFTDAAAADDFDGFSGDQGGPPFPGEDFIVNAPDGLSFPTDLTQSTIVISVEPDPDDNPGPFALKPLVSEVADGIGDHQVQTLSAGPAAPTGVATLR